MTATPKFPLGVYVYDPSSTDPSNEASFVNSFDTFSNTLGSVPQFMDAYTDYYASFNQWVPIEQQLIEGWVSTPQLAGVIPVMTIPMATTNDWNDADTVFKNIVAGDYDNVFIGLVTAWRDAGYSEIFARIGPEFNGGWEPWFMGSNPIQVQDFVAAWQHIATLVHNVSGINVQTVWNPSAINYTAEPTSSAYPGDKYVDVMGADVYSWVQPNFDGLYDWSTGQTDASAQAWLSNPVNREHYWENPNATQYNPNGYDPGQWGMQQIIAFAEQHNKPIGLAETGAGGDGVSDGPVDDPLFVQWLDQQLSTATVPIDFVNIWDINNGGNGTWDFTDGTRPAEAAAWQQYFGVTGGTVDLAPPVPAVLGTGSSVLMLSMAEDAYQGDAQFTVSVNGVQQGGTLTAQASHSAGQSQTFTFLGSWNPTASNTVTVTFLNAASGGVGESLDLYINGYAIDGVGTTVEVEQQADGSKTFTFGNLSTVPVLPPPVVKLAAAPAGSNDAPAQLGTVLPGIPGDPLMVTLTSDADYGVGSGSVVFLNYLGDLIYEPGIVSSNGTNTIAYTITDSLTGASVSEKQTVQLSVGTGIPSGNTFAPIVKQTPAPVATTGQTIVIGTAVSDVSGDPLTVMQTTDANATGSTLVLNNGTLLYTPGTITLTGGDYITYTVTDTVSGAITNETQTVSLTTGLTPVPVVTLASAPSANSTTAAVLGTVAAGTAGDALTVTLKSDPDYATGSTLVLNNGTLIYTPGTITQSGTDLLGYTITDTTNGTFVTETQSVALTAGTTTAKPPVVTLAAAPAATSTSAAVLGTVAAGVSGDTLKVALISDADYATGSTLVLNNGTLTYTPGTISQSGTDIISYTVTDSTNGTSVKETQSVVLTAAGGTVSGSTTVSQGQTIPSTTIHVSNATPWAAATSANPISTQIGADVYSVIGVASDGNTGKVLVTSTAVTVADDQWGTAVTTPPTSGAGNSGSGSGSGSTGGTTTISTTISQGQTAPSTTVHVSNATPWATATSADPISTTIGADTYSVIGVASDGNTGMVLLTSTPVTVADDQWGTAVTATTTSGSTGGSGTGGSGTGGSGTGGSGTTTISTVIDQGKTSPSTTVDVSDASGFATASAANPISTKIGADTYSVIGVTSDGNTGSALLTSSPVSVADDQWGTAVSATVAGGAQSSGSTTTTTTGTATLALQDSSAAKFSASVTPNTSTEYGTWQTGLNNNVIEWTEAGGVTGLSASSFNMVTLAQLTDTTGQSWLLDNFNESDANLSGASTATGSGSTLTIDNAQKGTIALGSGNYATTINALSAYAGAAANTFTVSMGSGTDSLTVNGSSNGTFASVTAGAGSETMAFIGMAGVTVSGGAGSATVSLGTGTATAIAGTGSLDVTGASATADTYVFHAGDGLLTIEDFLQSKGDVLDIDSSLKSSLSQTQTSSGLMLSFGTDTTHGILLHGVTSALPANAITWT